MSYKKLRRHLDELGYYQPLVPEALPLVEALLNDLLATTHNLKLCKEQKRSKCDCQTSLKNRKSSNETKDEREAENLQIIDLKRKVGDLQLLQHVMKIFKGCFKCTKLMLIVFPSGVTGGDQEFAMRNRRAKQETLEIGVASKGPSGDTK